MQMSTFQRVGLRHLKTVLVDFTVSALRVFYPYYNLLNIVTINTDHHPVNLPVGAARDVQPRWKGIRIPVPGSFGPFSDGARGCLGRKFAEVEMVAILATIFKEYKVDIQCQPGETYKEARTRVQGALNESSNQLTCSVRVDVGLSLSRRS